MGRISMCKGINLINANSQASITGIDLVEGKRE